MVIKGKKIDIKALTLSQLHALDDSFEMFLFKESHLFTRGEPFADSYRKDPKHFREILRLMVSMKRALMAYFQKQYQNRYNLVRIPAFKFADTVDDSIDQNASDEGDDSIYIYIDNWDEEDDQLAKILQQYKQQAYDLGISGFISQTGNDTNHTSYDAGAVFIKKAQTISESINDVTKKRIIQAIKTSLELGETRNEFEDRLKKIMVNPYRGRFISQNEGLQSYLDGKDEVATQDKSITKKTWIGVQPDPSEICGQVLNDTVGIDETFSNGLDGPLAHLGCKCDLLYS